MMRRCWRLINNAVFLVAVATTVAQWFRPTIPSTVADLLFIVTFAMYLASEKVEGRTLPIHEKAFCYFVTYVLGFFVIERQLHKFIPKPEMIYIVLSVAFFLILLVAFQIRYFRRQTNSRVAAGSVLVLGLLAMTCMGYVPSVHLFRAQSHLKEKATMAGEANAPKDGTISPGAVHEKLPLVKRE